MPQHKSYFPAQNDTQIRNPRASDSAGEVCVCSISYDGQTKQAGSVGTSGTVLDSEEL